MEGVSIHVLESVLLLLLDELFKCANGFCVRDLDGKNAIGIIAEHPTIEFK
jgi:hypothetical protein